MQNCAPRVDWILKQWIWIPMNRNSLLLKVLPGPNSFFSFLTRLLMRTGSIKSKATSVMVWYLNIPVGRRRPQHRFSHFHHKSKTTSSLGFVHASICFFYSLSVFSNDSVKTRSQLPRYKKMPTTPRRTWATGGWFFKWIIYATLFTRHQHVSTSEKKVELWCPLIVLFTSTLRCMRFVSVTCAIRLILITHKEQATAAQ